MALTEQDKIECKEIAREIVKEVLAEHIATCPHHQEYLIDQAKLNSGPSQLSLAGAVTYVVRNWKVAALVFILFGSWFRGGLTQEQLQQAFEKLSTQTQVVGQK